MKNPLSQQVHAIATLLLQRNQKIVFAESCTAGLLSALLATVPGISELHCGSSVVYRLETKKQWLGVPDSLLINPGPVSDAVASAMVSGVLNRTAEANLAVAITGILAQTHRTIRTDLCLSGLVSAAKLAA